MSTYKPIYPRAVFFLCFLVIAAASEAADTFSGRLAVRSIGETEKDSPPEDTGLAGRIRYDSSSAHWQVRSWVEGGWDGTVQHPERDERLFKNFRSVYQSNSPFVEIKELYGAYTAGGIELRGGIQRFAWGRLDEFPPTDLLNPWDYTQFLRKPLEDRKIGVPSLLAGISRGDWSTEIAWVPLLVPYRLPLPGERWSGTPVATNILHALPNAAILSREPDLPPRTADNGSVGLRVMHTGGTEWALTFFHGYDLRPVFRSSAFTFVPVPGGVMVDPGFAPDFRRISAIGADAAIVLGNWSLRAEGAYAFHRAVNIRPELWGYPAAPNPAAPYPLNPIERITDTLEYGMGADYRLFEDCLITAQAQQTVMLDHADVLYEKKRETMLWVNVKTGWLNQKFETNLGGAYNPEHKNRMAKAGGWYILSDTWKVGLSAIAFTGPPHSIFGKYARNDQLEAELIYAW